MKLKTLLYVFVLWFLSCFLVSVARAGTEAPGVYFATSGVEFWYPLAHVDATPYWKSITTGDEMVGAQTQLISYPETSKRIFWGILIPEKIIKVNFGAITSAKANGMPYASLTFVLWNIQNLRGDNISYIGFGYGKDFKNSQEHLLIGATFPIW